MKKVVNLHGANINTNKINIPKIRFDIIEPMFELLSSDDLQSVHMTKKL